MRAKGEREREMQTTRRKRQRQREIMRERAVERQRTWNRERGKGDIEIREVICSDECLPARCSLPPFQQLRQGTPLFPSFSFLQIMTYISGQSVCTMSLRACATTGATHMGARVRSIFAATKKNSLQLRKKKH